jgi:transcriptional regulator with XRE-family HTH domain
MPETFGEFLKRFRSTNRLLQVELSSILDVERSSVSRWENDDSLPKLKDARVIASKLNVEAEYPTTEKEVSDAIEESLRRSFHSISTILGKYELFQWSYVYDRKIMKTNILIRKGARGLEFEEHLIMDRQVAVIRGTVSIILQNMFMYGKSSDQYKECEVIIVNIPRNKDTWLRGVVAGVSSDQFNFPSASRVVLHCLGAQDFSPPVYLPINRVQLPGEERKFLAEQPEATCPILSSRPRN